MLASAVAPRAAVGLAAIEQPDVLTGDGRARRTDDEELRASQAGERDRHVLDDLVRHVHHHRRGARAEAVTAAAETVVEQAG